MVHLSEFSDFHGKYTYNMGLGNVGDVFRGNICK